MDFDSKNIMMKYYKSCQLRYNFELPLVLVKQTQVYADKTGQTYEVSLQIRENVNAWPKSTVNKSFY